MIAKSDPHGKERRPRAIIFDDDDCVREVVAHLLRRRGYEVVEFSDTEECCRFPPPCPCQAHETCADVMISDLRMPGRDGLEFLDMLAERGCKVARKALMSGYWTAKTLEHAADRGYRIFRKPTGIWEIERWLKESEHASNHQPRLVDYFRTGPSACKRTAQDEAAQASY